ncbi:MAG: hypothetical protein LBU09_01905, partial [Endomicrobium sp.]|nr:hypothetical protein [Endomicrobium sp.]
MGILEDRDLTKLKPNKQVAPIYEDEKKASSTQNFSAYPNNPSWLISLLISQSTSISFGEVLNNPYNMHYVKHV